MNTCPVALQAQLRPDAEAIVFGARRWTWRSLEHHVRRFAAALAARGIGPGDRVATISGNRPELVALFHAAGRVGAVLCPLNARLTRTEQDALLRRCDPKWVLASDVDFAVQGGAPAAAQVWTPGSSDLRAILFTSGTSGVPKAVGVTFGQFEALARASGANLGADASQRWLGCMPLFHIGALAMAHRCARMGAALILHARFEAAKVAHDLVHERITHASFVPTGLSWVLDALGEIEPGALRAVLIGGGPMGPELLARARKRGLPVLQTYGLTEACSQVCTERPGQADGRTAGPPLEGLEVRIVDEGGATVPPGTPGEIQVRGPTVMSGYLDDPEATAAAFQDGWLRTRDLGTLDRQGRLTVLARRTDLIVTGGENVYPAEVEAVLGEHPAVQEVAVTAAPDPEWGERVVALWAARPGASADASDLQAWCRARLAGFKVPRQFIPVGELPRTGNGKVDRAQVRHRAQQQVDAGIRGHTT